MASYLNLHLRPFYFGYRQLLRHRHGGALGLRQQGPPNLPQHYLRTPLHRHDLLRLLGYGEEPDGLNDLVGAGLQKKQYMIRFLEL